MIKGKGGIGAEVVADSIANGIRLTTLSLVYPRFIHAEFMTHRMFSRNASSSRAIPVDKLLKQIDENPAMPIHWGKNQPGMQAREECTAVVKPDWCGPMNVDMAWKNAAAEASEWANAISLAGYHKQIVNRLTEPFQFIKVVVTATEWENFFKLRLHPDAQPEIQELARVIKITMDSSKPQELRKGYWHVPYVPATEDIPAVDGEFYDWDTAIKASVARCARVSYQNHDGTNPALDKDIALHDTLLAAGHMSPFEHVATPIPESWHLDWEDGWPTGVTHRTRDQQYWSGNFRGWVQYRQTLD